MGDLTFDGLPLHPFGKFNPQLHRRRYVHFPLFAGITRIMWGWRTKTTEIHTHIYTHTYVCSFWLCLRLRVSRRNLQGFRTPNFPLMSSNRCDVTCFPMKTRRTKFDSPYVSLTSHVMRKWRDNDEKTGTRFIFCPIISIYILLRLADDYEWNK